MPSGSTLDWRSMPFAVWAARALVYFVVQGAGLLAAYAALGFDTSPDNFPPGFRLDPVHASVHLAWGLTGVWVGFRRPDLAVPFILVFTGFYFTLAVFGTFTETHFCMRLAAGENTFHWLLSPVALLIGLHGLIYRERWR